MTIKLTSLENFKEIIRENALISGYPTKEKLCQSVDRIDSFCVHEDLVKQLYNSKEFSICCQTQQELLEHGITPYLYMVINKGEQCDRYVPFDESKGHPRINAFDYPVGKFDDLHYCFYVSQVHEDL
jgi:hypothetical protein